MPKAKIYEKVYDVLKGILFPNARGGVLVLLCRSGGGAAFAQDCFAVRNHLQLSGLQTTFGGLKRCAMPFVAHVALRGILTNLIKCSV